MIKENNQMNSYFNSISVELKRSQIKAASYNPRKISEEGRKALKKSIKLYGVVGGIVVNKQTGFTIVGGHQKVSVLDELNKYNPQIKENDYTLRVELIDVDEKTEKQLNITLNNPNVGGDWDYDKMRELVPEIDYKSAGLTEADLSMIGCDFLLQTQEESGIADELDSLMSEVNEEKNQTKAEKQRERAEKTAHMKEVKAQVKEAAQKAAGNMDAYLMLSFDTYEAKEAFCRRFGYDGADKFIKGEDFDSKVELVIE